MIPVAGLTPIRTPSLRMVKPPMHRFGQSMDITKRGALPRLSVVASGNPSGSRNGGGFLTTTSVTVTPSGGRAPYSYSWSNVTGDSFSITSPSAATTTFGVNLNNGQSKNGIYRCNIRSDDGQCNNVDIAVSVNSNFTALSANNNAPSTSVIIPYVGPGLHTIYTSTVVCNAFGGTGNYNWLWQYVSGDAISIESAGNSGTRFYAGFGANGISYSAVFRCRVFDGIDTVYGANLPVTIATSP